MRSGTSGPLPVHLRSTSGFIFSYFLNDKFFLSVFPTYNVIPTSKGILTDSVIPTYTVIPTSNGNLMR